MSCAPQRGRSKLRRRPSEPPAGVRHRAAASRLREHSPVPLRALPARTPCTRAAPTPVLQAGGWVAAAAPDPLGGGAAAVPCAPARTLEVELSRLEGTHTHTHRDTQTHRHGHTHSLIPCSSGKQGEEG